MQHPGVSRNIQEHTRKQARDVGFYIAPLRTKKWKNNQQPYEQKNGKTNSTTKLCR